MLTLARAEDRLLLTFDEDFGELAFRQRLKAAGSMKGRRRLDDRFAAEEVPDWGWLVDRVMQGAR